MRPYETTRTRLRRMRIAAVILLPLGILWFIGGWWFITEGQQSLLGRRLQGMESMIAIQIVNLPLVGGIVLFVMSFLLPPRIKPNVCQRCGYDMRGSGATCPECGTPTDQ